MEKPLWYRWARVYVTGFSIVATGVLLFKYTVPTDEELIARFSPDIRADYERNKALRQKEQQELMSVVQETMRSNDPIWKAGKIKSPFERDTRGVDPRLVDTRKFFLEQDEERRRQEVAAASAELAETEQLVAQSKKRRWWLW